jgi:hypothetical protein
MTETFLSAMVSDVHPSGAMFVIPSYKATGEMDLIPPL